MDFNGKDLNRFFQCLNTATEQFGVDYFVVGAFARDLLFEHYQLPKGLATRDIDIAIALDSWEKYEAFTQHLIGKEHFKQGGNLHEFISAEGIYTDILPYGNIEVDRMLELPPDFVKQMNMFGFQEVYDFTIEHQLNEKLVIKIASLEAIALLKFIAWKDRQPDRSSQKHTRDISRILEVYYDLQQAQIVRDFAYLFDLEDFDTIVCGAIVLGHHIKQIASNSPALQQELNTLFDSILADEDNSLFLLQMTQVSAWEYGYCWRVFEALREGHRQNRYI